MVKFLVPNDSNKCIRVNQIYRQFPIASRKVATLSRYVTVSQFHGLLDKKAPKAATAPLPSAGSKGGVGLKIPTNQLGAST